MCICFNNWIMFGRSIYRIRMSSIQNAVQLSVCQAGKFRRGWLNSESERSVIRLNGGKKMIGLVSCINVDAKNVTTGSVGAGEEKSKELMEVEKRVLVGTYARTPVVLASGSGCKLVDVEGREYLDLSSGIAVNALGHGDRDWLEAVVEQANVLAHVSNVYYSIPQVI